MPAQRAFRTAPLALVAALFILLWDSRPARAFDTGPHSDMTRAAFQDEGFSSGSAVIGIAQVSNWLVDYYSSRPSLPGSQEAVMAGVLAHLHFDSLTSVLQIRNSWNRLALNTQRSVQAAARAVLAAPDQAERQRRLIYLAVLIGASLHPVQDFYSHSNWVETYPMRGGIYGTRTWFDTPSPSASLRTGLVGPGNELHPTGDPARDHGDNEKGMNHDSYDRRGWSQAYVYAYSASRQWLAAVRQWVQQADPAVWRELTALRLSKADAGALDADLTAAYELSLWIYVPFKKDGAWKGRGSAGTTSLATAGGWMTAKSSIFLKLFRDSGAYRPLALDMERRDTDPGSTPAMPAVRLARRAVEVRTLHAAMTDGSPDAPPSWTSWLGVPALVGLLDEADMFGVVTIAGQSYTEATRQGSNDIRPRWLSVGFVPDTAGRVSVRYELFDEDGGWGGGNDTIDVNPAKRRVSAAFQLDVRTHALSGDLSGVHDTEQRAAALQGGGGDPDPAVVKLYVTERALEEPNAGATPPSPAVPPGW